jgi:hypothetical protein
MQALVYILCLVTSGGCAVLLTRGYLRNRVRLLLWAAVCFVGLTVNNLLLVLDLLVLPTVDLTLWRLTSALVAVAVLLYGFIWETD